jgi:hypothetical protein
VLGTAHYGDDFGEPRPGGPHQGVDILAPRKAFALAAEAGKVEFWTTSASAGCMLYLHGKSGTTYQYIHLNNDLTRGNDNRGKCVPGTAYAPGLKTGATVTAGQPVGFVGDSGDADGIHPHLHFEVHPGGGKAVDPFPFLKAAQHLLFAAPVGTPFTLELRGTVLSASPTTLQLRIAGLTAWPMRQRLGRVARPLALAVPETAVVQSTAAGPAKLASARRGQQIKVWTQPALATLKAERGDDLALSAALVLLGKRP